jgi:Ni2+-binding GTPase involved in maturation of urease and hydrogenase
MTAPDQPPRAAIGAQVGSGKTALIEQLCKHLRLDAIVAFLRAKGGLKGAF